MVVLYSRTLYKADKTIVADSELVGRRSAVSGDTQCLTCMKNGIPGDTENARGAPRDLYK